MNEGEWIRLGPFNYNFTGTLKNSKPVVTVGNGTVLSDYTIWEYEGSTLNQKTGIKTCNLSSCFCFVYPLLKLYLCK